MSTDAQADRSCPQLPRVFATTQWSIVVAAGKDSSPQSRQALSMLCETYWYPLYAYVRRKGHQASEAQDLTQAFFAFLIEKQTLRVADRERGRFRSFLLASLNHFLANEWRRATAQRRGGGQTILSLDFDDGEQRYRCEPSHEMTAENIFERRWAMTLLESAVSRLQAEYEQANKAELYESLKGYLGGQSDTVPYKEIAARLNMSEGAIKVTVHRLRARCRELLRAAIAETVTSPEEIDDELRQLFHAVQA